MESCVTCAGERGVAELPLRERIAVDEHWRVAHAFGTALPGWLVLLPRRHVTAIADLTDAEAVGLGVWQVRLSRALHRVTGCAKTYVAQFAEAPGFGHVHFHVIPRAVDLAAESRGPSIFGLLDAAHEVPVAERDALAGRLAAYLAE
ncbi:HIT family protein [Actinomadura rubteroloni]|uniref:HIT family protein n=1 Tax=Actinomadura rubteroloni TaxID=1926885 RepID=UPI000CD7FCE8|nr:HIT family protein [Actinomadura rubteroloni]